MPSLDTNSGRILLSIARAAICQALGHAHSADESGDWLRQAGACFVTLTQENRLRGCIGTLEAHRPLLADVKANAYAAAFSDPRFVPLRASELSAIDIEVSLLSPMQPIYFQSEADALAQLQPGSDGVLFEYGRYRSTFLPQVWEQLPNAVEFIAQLKRKSGLPAHFWADEVKLYRYSVRKWRERELQQSADYAEVS